MPWGLRAASPTRVVLADTMAVGPAIVAREGLLRHTPRWPRSCARLGRPPPLVRRRIRQLLVGRCERRDCRGQCKVGSNELLESGRIVRGREREIIERRLESVDRWRRLNRREGPAERLTSARGQNLTLALNMRETEGRLPRSPGPGAGC